MGELTISCFRAAPAPLSLLVSELLTAFIYLFLRHVSIAIGAR